MGPAWRIIKEKQSEFNNWVSLNFLLSFCLALVNHVRKQTSREVAETSRKVMPPQAPAQMYLLKIKTMCLLFPVAAE
jgi:hypothetical protein